MAAQATGGAPTSPDPAQPRVLAGLLLIAVGLFALATYLLPAAGAALFVVLGAAFAIGRFWTGRYGYAVPAGILLGFGAFVVLSGAHRLPTDPGGWFFAMLGLGFVGTYVIGGRAERVWPLYPAAVLLGIGALAIAAPAPAVLAGFLWMLPYSPLLLVLLGAWLLWRDRVPPAYRGVVRVGFFVLFAAYALLAAAAVATALGGAWSGVGVGGGPPVLGSGVVRSEARPVQSFERVEMSGIGVMTIRQGASEALVVEADDNLLPTIRSESRGGELVVGPDRAALPTRPIRYELTVTRLTNVTVNGAGSVDAAGLTTDDLRVDLSGAGHFTGSGTAGHQVVTISGTGDYAGGELAGRDAEVTINGTGSAIVNASDRLRAVVNGTGSIGYIGSPTVTQSINGLGTVRPAGP
jgi:hypothetical protein